MAGKTTKFKQRQKAAALKLMGQPIYVVMKDGRVAAGKLVKVQKDRLLLRSLNQSKGKKVKTKALLLPLLFSGMLGFGGLGGLGAGAGALGGLGGLGAGIGTLAGLGGLGAGALGLMKGLGGLGGPGGLGGLGLPFGGAAAPGGLGVGQGIAPGVPAQPGGAFW